MEPDTQASTRTRWDRSSLLTRSSDRGVMAPFIQFRIPGELD